MLGSFELSARSSIMNMRLLLADGKNLKLNLTMLIILNKRPQCCLLKNIYA